MRTLLVNGLCNIESPLHITQYEITSTYNSIVLECEGVPI